MYLLLSVGFRSDNLSILFRGYRCGQLLIVKAKTACLQVEKYDPHRHAARPSRGNVAGVVERRESMMYLLTILRICDMPFLILSHGG